MLRIIKTTVGYHLAAWALTVSALILFHFYLTIFPLEARKISWKLQWRHLQSMAHKKLNFKKVFSSSWYVSWLNTSSETVSFHSCRNEHKTTSHYILWRLYSFPFSYRNHFLLLLLCPFEIKLLVYFCCAKRKLFIFFPSLSHSFHSISVFSAICLSYGSMNSINLIYIVNNMHTFIIVNT